MNTLTPERPLPPSTPVDPGLDVLRERLLADIEQAPSPTRAVVQRTRIIAGGLALAMMLGVLLLAGVNLDTRPAPLVIATFGGALTLSLLALWLALGLGRSMLGRPWRMLALGILAIPILLFTWKAVLSLLTPGMDLWVDERPGFRCLGWSLAIALGPMSVFLWLQRHTAPHHPGTLGAALGMAAGVSAWALLDLYCPVGHAGHLLLGHVLPALLLAVLGLFAGRILFRR